jgi:hypothetical protein
MEQFERAQLIMAAAKELQKLQNEEASHQWVEYSISGDVFAPAVPCWVYWRSLYLDDPEQGEAAQSFYWADAVFEVLALGNSKGDVAALIALGTHPAPVWILPKHFILDVDRACRLMQDAAPSMWDELPRICSATVVTQHPFGSKTGIGHQFHNAMAKITGWRYGGFDHFCFPF